MRSWLWKTTALCLLLSALPLSGKTEPRLWDPSGVNIRQGYHIEWGLAGEEDESGNIVYSWSDTRSTDRDVYAQKVSPSGQKLWGAQGKLIVHAVGRQEDPQLVLVGNGQFIFAWNDFRGDTARGDLYAQKIDANGNRLWAETGVLLSEGMISNGSDPAEIRMVHDGSGGSVIIWQDLKNGAWDIYAIRVLADGSIPTAQWPQDGLAVDTASAEQTGISVDTDGAGGALVCWTTNHNAAKGKDVRIQRVTNTGQLPWGGSSGALIGGALEDQEKAKLCPDGAGGAYIVWVDKRNGEEDLYYQRVPNSGPSLNDSLGLVLVDTLAKQLEPRITAVGSNQAMIAWLDTRNDPYGLNQDVYAQKIGVSGILWTQHPTGLPICTNIPDDIKQERVRINADGAGGAICIWSDPRDVSLETGSIYAQKINGNGTVAWTANGIPVTSPQSVSLWQDNALIRAAANYSFVAWEDERSGSNGIWLQKLGASGNRMLAAAGDTLIWGISGDAESAKIVPTNLGRHFIFFEDARFAGFTAFFQIQDSLGNILLEPNGRAVCPIPPQDQEWSQLSLDACSDGNNGAIVVWEDHRTANPSYQIYAQRLNASGAPLWSVSGVRIAPNIDEQQKPRVVPDGNGGALVAWLLSYQSNYKQIYAAKIAPDGSVPWVTPVATGSYDQILDDIIDDGFGGLYLSYYIQSDLTDRDLYVQHLNAAGNPLWGSGLTIYAGNWNQHLSVLRNDENDGALIVWVDSRYGEFVVDLFAQKITFDGIFQWSSTGLPVCTAPQDQSAPRLSLDNSDNLSIIWKDYRVGNNDLYLQKISPVGQSFFPTNGVPVCNYAEEQNNPILTGDGSGGNYFFWQDARMGSQEDLYGLHWDTNGNFPSSGGWVADGIPICDAYKSQKNPVSLSDQANGAIVVWEDQRSSGKKLFDNLYSQRVNDGTVSPVEPRPTGATPRTLELYKPYPNPFNPEVLLSFSLPRAGHVHLAIYDLLGRPVALLREGWQPAGLSRFTWRAENLASGLYLARLEFEGNRIQQKVVLVK